MMVQNIYIGQMIFLIKEKYIKLFTLVSCVGNHERNPLFFHYFELPLNGTNGYEEHWWYKDHSNVRIISMDSNNGYRIQEQLEWLDSILSITTSDTIIDFVFAQLHHPIIRNCGQRKYLVHW